VCVRPADTHAHGNGTAMTLPILLLPGIGGSGPDHWQSHWERTDPDMTRFAPSDWDRPELADWCEALDRAVGTLDRPPIMVAHSLACLLVAHWVAARGTPVAGAMLVAVPDPCGQVFPDEARSFAQVPEQPLRFPSLIVTASGPDMHIDTPVEDSEDFRTVVDVPAVGLVGPVQPDGGVADPLDR